jgi:site-specific DNA recombinase
MIAIGYARVSTDKQDKEGVSMEAQTTKIRAAVTLHDDWTLTEIISDGGESAKSLDRPGMLRILAMMDAGEVGAVIVAKLDRLTRSVKDLAILLEHFQRNNVVLVSIAEALDTASAAGRLVLNIMMSVSQWEREAISERTRDALAHKRSKGERAGTIPYGYCSKLDGITKQTKDGRTVYVQIEEAPEEQTVIAEIKRLRKRGRGWTTRAIAEELNRKGLRMRQDREWTFGRVAQILKSTSAPVRSAEVS